MTYCPANDKTKALHFTFQLSPATAEFVLGSDIARAHMSSSPVRNEVLRKLNLRVVDHIFSSVLSTA